MSGWEQVADGLAVLRGFLPEPDQRGLERWLWEQPVHPAGSCRGADGFAFCELEYDGERVPGRVEAACGEPIFEHGRARRGGPVPTVLRPLLGDASEAVGHLALPTQARLGPAGFTSLYADRFAPGGRFVPHADREIYGPLVATLSLGAPATVRFSRRPDVASTDEPEPGPNDDSGDDRSLSVDLRLAPGDLYAFWPPMRHAPWVHEVLPVEEPRISVSLRTAASPGDH